MLAQRKFAREQYSRIDMIRHRLECLKDNLLLIASEEEYQKHYRFFEKILKKLSHEIESMPAGYRYQGVYYIKEPYTIPPEYTKHEGSIFMREDLVSWQKEDEGYPDGAYYRTVFKDPKGEQLLTKEDAVPVPNYPSRWEVMAQQESRITTHV